MKKLTGFVVFAVIMLAMALAANADSNLSFEYAGRIYSLKEAALPESRFPFHVENRDGIVMLSDPSTGLLAYIRHDILDETSLSALKKYYNDYASSDFELFDKFLELQKSYLPVMQDLYRMNWLYGGQDDPYSESNMKVFYQNNEVVFGNLSEVILYNTYDAGRQGIHEETHLDLIIPVYKDLSLISINITFKAGTLDEKTKASIYRLLGSLHFPDLPKQTETLKVFSDAKAVEASNKGIYNSGNSNILLELRNEASGYALLYPSSYLPYMENSLGGRMDYISYKISPDHIFSISAERSSASEAVYGKPSYIREFYGERLLALEESSMQTGERDFLVLDYAIQEGPGITNYIRECFTAGRQHIYSLRLSSRYERPSPALLDEFNKILYSFTEIDANTSSSRTYSSMTKYTGKDKGYSFLYPLKWKLTDKSAGTGFDSLSLKMPELSGPIDISISEAQLKSDISLDDVPRILYQSAGGNMDEIIENYNPPYKGTEYRLLSHSSYRENDTTRVYRLLNYLDTDNRARLCHSIDLIKGNKVYSMFISVSEYATNRGALKDAEVGRLINTIAASFKLEGSPEGGQKGFVAETSSLKVVRLEGLLKKQLGYGASIVQAVTTKDDNIYYVMVEGIEDSGIYKIKTDNGFKSVSVEDKLLSSKDCEAFFEDILFTDVKVTFAPGDDLFGIDRQRAENGHFYTAVYAEFGDTKGFAVLDIDPHGQIIDVISFKSSSNLAEEISARIEQSAESGFIIDYTVDKKRFTLNFHFYSPVRGHFFKSYRLTLNHSTQSLICIEE